jgi:starch synthase
VNTPFTDRTGSKLRVAFVSFEYGDNCLPLVNALADHADMLLLLTQDQFEPHRDHVDASVRVRSFRKPRLRHPFRQIALCRSIARELKEFHPDVLHVQQGHFWFNLILPRLKRRYPTVVTIHDERPHVGDLPSRKTPQAVMNIAFRAADRVIVHAEEMKQRVVDELHISPSLIDVIPLAVTVEPNEGDLDGDRMPGPVVLFFGRIWPYKGLEYLIRAEPRISAAVPDVQFVIAGSGEEFGRYEAMMEHPERFEVRDEFIPHDDVQDLMRNAAVVAAPYIDATQSGVLPTAYAAGRPVVATRVGAFPEMVDDGVTGILVSPRDVVALADAIIAIISNPARWRAMSTAARHRVETDWSPSRLAEQTMATYESALGVVGTRR